MSWKFYDAWGSHAAVVVKDINDGVSFYFMRRKAQVLVMGWIV